MASESDMYFSVYLRLRSRYPAKDGWEITPQFRGKSGTYIPDFVVRRVYRKVIQVVPVEVKDECVAHKNHVDQLNRYAMSLAGTNVSVVAKILVYPAFAVTSIVPPDITKMFIRTYYCDWKKKPVKMVKTKS